MRDGITRGRWQEVAHVSNDRTTADLFFTFDLGSAKVVNGIAAYPCTDPNLPFNVVHLFMDEAWGLAS